MGYDPNLGTPRWKDVFERRSFWKLDVGKINNWAQSNRAFFTLVQDHVPRGSRILELGSGPGRHSICLAMIGYQVVGLEINSEIIAQARTNATRIAPSLSVRFMTGDIFNLSQSVGDAKFDAIVHGGLMEHFSTAEMIQESVAEQLKIAPIVIFDIPIYSAKNLRLFQADDVFRQVWPTQKWLDTLAQFSVIQYTEEMHPEPGMTDDLIIAISRLYRSRG
jgi:SAM-dependent methyltransferase